MFSGETIYYEQVDNRYRVLQSITVLSVALSKRVKLDSELHIITASYIGWFVNMVTSGVTCP